MTKEKDLYAVATFHSTHSVLKAEKILKEAGLEQVRIVPVQSRISSGYGGGQSETQRRHQRHCDC